MSPTVDESLLSLLGLFGLLAGVVGYLWTGLALSAMFRKMGEESWKGWVPVFNLATVLAWGGFSPWLVLVGFIPIVGQVALLILLMTLYYRIDTLMLERLLPDGARQAGLYAQGFRFVEALNMLGYLFAGRD